MTELEKEFYALGAVRILRSGGELFKEGTIFRVTKIRATSLETTSPNAAWHPYNNSPFYYWYFLDESKTWEWVYKPCQI